MNRSNLAKPVLFEVVTLLGLVIIGIIGSQIDTLLRLPTLPNSPYNYLGYFPVVCGISLRFWASFNFFSLGKGTPFYLRPTQTLVTEGPYKYIRNPLYVGGYLIYIGVFLIVPSIFLVALGSVGLPTTGFAVIREERGLDGRFGQAYGQYKRNVPGWIPRVRKGK